MLESFGGALLGPDVRLFPLYILSTVAIAFLVFRTTRPGTSFGAWLLPAKIWKHPSTRLDAQLFFVGRLLTVAGLFNQLAITNAATVLVLVVLRGQPDMGAPVHPWIAATLILLGNDLAVYWVHRLHHENARLWPFHALHHSAEVMTPITVYRKHPVYDLISSVMRGITFGCVQGIVLAIFFGSVSVALVVGVNAFYFLFNLLGSNLRHTHIWLSYGTLLEHVLISPAQHQIHHSRAPGHRNKNYGEVLAIWDWMFGTLYIPRKREVLAFGLADEMGNALPQPYNTLAEALIHPMLESLEPVRNRIGRLKGNRP